MLHIPKESHTFSSSLKEIIFGMEDGIVTALGTVLGVGAATSDSRIVIIAGIVALFAEALSMFFGSYLGTKSEKEVIEKTISEEKLEMKEIRSQELEEMRQAYKKMGFAEKEIKILLARLDKNDKLFLEQMLIHEFGIMPRKIESPFRVAMKFWLATMIGIITIVPFLFLPVKSAMLTAGILAMATMFAAGALKTKYTKKELDKKRNRNDGCWVGSCGCRLCAWDDFECCGCCVMFMPFMLLYITNPSQAAAKKVALHLLKKRLGACANIFPVHSAYLWKGKLVRAHEWILIFKTISKNYKKVEKEIRKIHPYSVPCIMKIPVSANRDYEKWLISETR